MSVDGVHVMAASYQFLALKFYFLPMDVAVQLTSVLLVSVKCLLLHVTYISPLLKDLTASLTLLPSWSTVDLL